MNKTFYTLPHKYQDRVLALLDEAKTSKECFTKTLGSFNINRNNFILDKVTVDYCHKYNYITYERLLVNKTGTFPVYKSLVRRDIVFKE